MKYFYILFLIHNITQMLNICSYCSKEIGIKNSIYFAYDFKCCSKICRAKISEIINNNDPKLYNPEKWKTLLKKSNIFEMNYKISINNINNVNNVNNSGIIKKTKSYKKDISLLKFTDEIINPNNPNQIELLNDSSSNIISCTFSTIKDYLNFTKISFLISINLTLINLSRLHIS